MFLAQCFPLIIRQLWFLFIKQNPAALFPEEKGLVGVLTNGFGSAVQVIPTSLQVPQVVLVVPEL